MEIPRLKDVVLDVKLLIINQVFPSTAVHARNTFLKDNKYLKVLKLFGEVKDEELAAIENDPTKQEMYGTIMKLGRDGGSHLEAAKKIIDGLPIQEVAGFFVFKRKYYEKKFNLKLISEEED